MDIVKLKQKMLETMKGGSFNYELTRVLGISYPTAINRLAVKSKFTTDEIKTLTERYKLTAEEVQEIFFGGTDTK